LSASLRRSERVRDVLLWAMPLLALAPKYWMIKHSLYASGRDILDTDTTQFGFFGFGDYIEHLYRSGVFEACRHLYFVPSKAGVCIYSSRMPGLPLLIAGLAKTVGTRSTDVALAKAVVMALLETGFLVALVRDVRLTWLGLLLAYVIYFGPQPLKHGASLEYEESLLADLALCLAVCASYVVRADQTQSARRRGVMAIVGVLVAGAMYLVKTTALPALLAMVLAVLAARGIGTRSKMACVAIALLSVAGWAAHNLRHSGSFHLTSSWNGENLLRGNDTGAYLIYPEIYLDRIMDSKQATLKDGTVVPLGDYTHTVEFPDEWSWDAYYEAKAETWLRSHPGTAFAFFLKKVWVTFFEIRQTPVYYSASAKIAEHSAAVYLLMGAWMLIARIGMFVLVGLSIRDALRRRHVASLWIGALVLVPFTPFMLVFAYQRHLIPWLIFSGVLLAITHYSRPANPRGNPAPKPPALPGDLLPSHIAPQ
jgi:hypothetical protein